MTVTEQRISIEELMRLPSFYFPAVSWDEKRVAYYSDETGRIELWVLDIESGETRQVSQGQIPRSVGLPPVWDREGRTIIFTRDVDGNEQHNLWSMNVESGEARQLTDTPNAQEIPLQFSPDNAWLSFLSTRNGQLNIFKIRPDGSEVTELSRFTNPVGWGGQWSPDGTTLIANVNETENLHNVDVYLVPADGSQAKRIWSTGGNSQDTANDWSPDGKSLAVSSDVSGVTRGGILDLASGEVRWLGAEGVEESADAFSSDGRLVLATRNENAVLSPIIYEAESGAERVPALPEGGSLAFLFDVAFALGGEALLVKYSTDATRPALLLYDLRASETRTLIAPDYGSIAPEVFVPAEDVYYNSADGLRIHALLFRPHGIPEGARVPAIVVPHGGPTYQYWHVFNVLFQYLANQGYVTLAPNIRGSTGYGVEFRDMARLDWGGADLEDVVAGREYLASLPFVDSDRIGITGGSYGGFMTFIAATKAPDKWKAASALVGVTDLPAMYAESMPHYKYFLEEQMGKPEENAELWRDRSAANFAHNLQCTLQIVHGINDPRCPVSQARIFRDRLQAAGKTEGRDYEYVELGEQGHGSTDQEQRIEMYGRVGDFLARRL
ncbi:MAG: S9 family peptidase [Chloroflexota bacterium]|nr:S9 family peptidase [Chloroflexota bacterium]